MCYFSDPANRPAPQGTMTAEQISGLADKVMSKALKMQIGCGAEPTLYRGLPQLIAAGKKAGVPYVEITTNGQLIDERSLEDAIEAGLDGITLSLHATTRETYEFLMEGASFDRLLQLIRLLGKPKGSIRTSGCASTTPSTTSTNTSLKDSGSCSTESTLMSYKSAPFKNSETQHMTISSSRIMTTSCHR